MSKYLGDLLDVLDRLDALLELPQRLLLHSRRVETCGGGDSLPGNGGREAAGHEGRTSGAGKHGHVRERGKRGWDEKEK